MNRQSLSKGEYRSGQETAHRTGVLQVKGAEMTVTYHYYCHYSPYAEQIETLHDALYRARNDVEYNLAAPDKIVLEDGTELDEEEILERSGYYSDINGPIIDGSIASIIEEPTRLLG